MAQNRQLHEILEGHLRDKITSGEWGPDTMITSENELAREFGISRMTARNAITHLVGEGLLYRIPGKGTFVSTPQTISNFTASACVRDQLIRQGTNISIQLLSKQQTPAPRQIAEALRIREGSTVWEIETLRLSDGEPLYYSHTYIDAAIAPDFIDDERVGFANSCDIMKEKYGLVIHRVHETLESAVASFQYADRLQVLPGHPLILLTELDYMPDERPLKHTQMYFRGDRIKLSFDSFMDQGATS